MPSTSGAAAPRRPPLARFEVVCVALLVVAGFGLRGAWPGRMAVEHFDEGVYAAELWFLDPPEAGSIVGWLEFWFLDNPAYPDRDLYAPPLLPWLARLSMHVVGPLGAMLPSLLAGGLTVGLVWWTGRRWFGPEAGLAAAALAAFSDVHLLYSRAALTDALLSFWLLSAVWLMWEALRAPGARAILAAGLATGLAWWTKYNGWLPLAIGLAGLTARCLFSRGGAPLMACRRPFFTWLAVAAVAVCVWSPVWLHLERSLPGGYRAVAENHARYLVGASGWSDALLRHAASHRHLEGWLSIGSASLALLLAIACSAHVARGFTWNTMNAFGARASALSCAVLCLLASAALFAGTSALLALLATAGLAALLWTRGAKASDMAPDGDARLAHWMLAAWFFGLLVVTPLYAPYPRLTLPWLAASWLGAGAALASLARCLTAASAPAANGPGSDRLPGARASAALALLALAVLGAAVTLRGERLMAAGVPGWQPRTEIRALAASVLEDARREAAATGRPPRGDVRLVVYVYAEPALVFHLAEAPDVVPQPAGNLGFDDAGVPTFLIAGPHAERSDEFVVQWRQHAERFEPVAEYESRPSDLVLLDQYDPRRLNEDRPLGAKRVVERMRLYRLRPKGGDEG